MPPWCIALFQGRKPALLYKLAPEELPGYDRLESCRVADYTPEWRLKEEQAEKKGVPAQTEAAPGPAPAASQSTPTDEPDPSKDLEYELAGADSSLGMVELDPAGVVGGDDEEEENPPGRPSGF